MDAPTSVGAAAFSERPISRIISFEATEYLTMSFSISHTLLRLRTNSRYRGGEILDATILLDLLWVFPQQVPRGSNAHPCHVRILLVPTTFGERYIFSRVSERTLTSIYRYNEDVRKRLRVCMTILSW